VTTQIPVFPLPLVLFPGTRLPLHIFEPRYRQMLSDLLDENEEQVDSPREFGILFRPEGVSEGALSAGAVGCIATIERSERLPDGRANVVVHGQRRFRFDGFVATDRMYRVGAVSPYDDVAEASDAMSSLIGEVRELFERVAGAARTLADDPDALPDLPEDPGLLAFSIAAMIDLDAAARQRLLASRSPSGRLRDIAGLLAGVVESLEHRAVVHNRAKCNGHGPEASPPPSAASAP
jgi:ATP-dependent Lon protease